MKKVIISIIGISIVFTICIISVFQTRKVNNTDISLKSTYSTSTSNQSSHINEEGKLNINTATASELMLLPGIGEAIANRIITYRTENGTFKSTHDLINIKGIGEQKLSEILDKICLE